MKKLAGLALFVTVLGGFAAPVAAHDVYVEYYYHTAPLPPYAVPYPSYIYSYTNRTVHYVYPSGAVYSAVVVPRPRAVRAVRGVRRCCR